jgi:hypothetical protein
MTHEMDEHADVQMPNPSYWPLVLAIGLALLLVGIVVSWYVAGLGFVIFMIALLGWLREPTGLEH